MPHRHPGVERGQRAAESGRRIALHQHQAGALRFEHGFERRHHPRRQLRQALARRHAVQVVIGTDAEHAEHLVEQAAVLRRHARPHFPPGIVGGEMPDHRTELDGFGARAENEQNFGHRQRYFPRQPRHRTRMGSRNAFTPRHKLTLVPVTSSHRTAISSTR